MQKKNITKKNIVNKIYQKLGFSKNLSSQLIEDFLGSLVNELVQSNIVKISSFGTFKVLNKKERIGRNPKNKVQFKISARKVVVFKPSLSFKNKLNLK
jgi:integration host factor subunit alpha